MPFTAGLSLLNVDQDRRRERRALTESEARDLIAATQKSDRIYRGLTGKDRAVMYVLAQRTGLRRSELKRITPRAFNLTAEPPLVVISARDSKGRREDVVPLGVELAEVLREYLADRPRGEPIWPGTWWRRSADMLRKDLEAAGIAAVDDEGRVIDFHGQRTTFITALARAGVSPAAAQKLARHSDVNLTMRAYTHLRVTELLEAIDTLPPLSGQNHGPEAFHADAPDASTQTLRPEDPSLAEVTAAWPHLSAGIRNGRNRPRTP